VVVLSMTDTDDCVKQAVSLGACGYLRKDASVEQLQHALQCVMTTGSYFPAEVARKLMSKPGQGTDDLTARQLEILRQIANGRTSKEIAHELNLSPKTVDVHRGRIMERLNIHDVPGLTRYAMRVGLLEP
jgi:DNA-binding NarL/FixJ family response regulator